MNNTEEFVRLMAENSSRLENYLRTLLPDAQDVADVMQDVAVALWQKFDQYDRSRPFHSWAYRFAYYQAINFREKMSHRRTLLDPDLMEKIASEYENQSGDLDLTLARESTLKNCVEKLPSRDRELVESYYNSTQKIQTIAGRWGVSIHRLYRGLKRIRRWLFHCMEDAMEKEGWNEAT